MPPRNLIITIDGPAASGKSSTAELVARALGIRHVDSGALYRDVTARRLGVDDIRSAEVTAAVSQVAKLPEVRAKVNAEVRRFAELGPVVADGRDMGNAVFTDAQLKVFLVADAGVRARRRLLQRLKREPSEAEIASETAELEARDRRDAEQTVQAPDARLLDTTYLTQDQQVQQIVAWAEALLRGDPAGIGRSVSP